MTLPLHGEEDLNGNAFPVSSSSSASSCSSTRMGESSPESLRSLSSLSGERTRSPLDYDMLEVTVVTTVTTPLEKTLTMEAAAETTEPNDNSVSVYLDANSEYQCELWNDNDSRTLALFLDTSSSGGGNDSSCPESNATELPVDEDEDEEEEVLFLSVSSDLGLCESGLIQSGSSSVTISVDEASGVVLAEVGVPLDEIRHPQASDDTVTVLDMSSPEVPAQPLGGAKEQQDPASKAEFESPSLPSNAAKISPRNSQQSPKLVHCKGAAHLTTSRCQTSAQVCSCMYVYICMVKQQFGC